MKRVWFLFTPLLIVIIIGSIFLKKKWNKENEMFYLKKYWKIKGIELYGQFQLVRPDEVVKSIRTDTDIITLDLQKIKLDLMNIVYIKNVGIDRSINGIIRIYIQERRPIAIAEVYNYGQQSGDIKSELYYISEDGVAMTYKDIGLDCLPRLYGIPYSAIYVGKQIQMEELFWALRLISWWSNTSLPRIEWCDLSEKDVVQCRLQNGTRIRFGIQNIPIELQVKRLFKIYDYGTENDKVLLQLDLSLRNNCPALWRLNK